MTFVTYEVATLKTIKQIADEIGVQKQTIRKRIEREPLCTLLSSHIHTKEGTFYIDVHGEKLIKSAYNIDMDMYMYTGVHTQGTHVPTYTHSDALKAQQIQHDRYVQDVHTMYAAQIKILQDQAVIDRTTIDQLTKTIATMNDTVNKALLLTNNAQHLHAAETMKLESSEQKQKQGFLKRVFSRKSPNLF